MKNTFQADSFNLLQFSVG